MKQDKSEISETASKKIVSLLRKNQKKPEDKIHYFIGRDDGKIFLGIVDVEKDVLHSYPLEWDAACFIAYCLLTEAFRIAGEAAANYMIELSKRKGSTVATTAFFATIYKKEDEAQETADST